MKRINSITNKEGEQEAAPVLSNSQRQRESKVECAVQLWFPSFTQDDQIVLQVCSALPPCPSVLETEDVFVGAAVRSGARVAEPRCALQLGAD
eukprot:7878584-Pyramimonas_sp.AAC.1